MCVYFIRRLYTHRSPPFHFLSHFSFPGSRTFCSMVSSLEEGEEKAAHLPEIGTVPFIFSTESRWNHRHSRMICSDSLNIWAHNNKHFLLLFGRQTLPARSAMLRYKREKCLRHFHFIRTLSFLKFLYMDKLSCISIMRLWLVCDKCVMATLNAVVRRLLHRRTTRRLCTAVSFYKLCLY